MNNNNQSINAIAPHSGPSPVVQRDANPAPEPMYSVDPASISPPSSNYERLFNEFVQLPNEDEHGAFMLATSHVDGVSTVNHNNTRGGQLPTDTRSADDAPSVGSGEPNLARIFSPSGRMSLAEIEELDLTPYSETIPVWEPVDETFNDSSPPRDHQLSDTCTQSPGGSALQSTVNLAHISAATPITIASNLAPTAPVPSQSTSTTRTWPIEINTPQAITNQSTSSTQNLIPGSVSIAISNNTGNITIHTSRHQPPLSLAGTVQTTQPYAQAGTLSTAPAPRSRATIIQPDLSVKAGTLVRPRALTSGSRLPKKKRNLLSNSAFTSLPLKQSWTPDGEVFPPTDNCTTHGPGAGAQPASKVSARESYSIIEDHPARLFGEAGAAVPNWSVASTQQGLSGPAEAYSIAQPTVSAQADLIYSPNYPCLNPVAPVQQSQSYPQRFDYTPPAYSLTELNLPTEANGTVRMGYTGSGSPTPALNGWSVPSAPVQHPQLYTVVQPLHLAQASRLGQSLTPAGFNQQDHSSTRTSTHAPTQHLAATSLPARPRPQYAPYHTQGPAQGKGPHPNGLGNPFQDGYPVIAYAAGPTGPSAPDGLTLGRPRPGAQTITSAPVHQHAPAEPVNEARRVGSHANAYSSQNSGKRRASWGVGGDSEGKRARYAGN